ncbi:MAG: crotonase/enoyl-CoA hydratase family protein [Acidimicrobiia bacterium]|nr:crotonase/enoyl-CoA hydratase family protein [Acidimicrobiia bacterium]
MSILERERRGRVEILRLNRPEARNAMSPELALAIEAALDDIEADRDVWIVVLTGTGPIFCAGADLKVVAAGRGIEISTERGGFGGMASRDFPKPIIAAVNGPALAGGFELALACDLVVAADNASFGLPEAKRGLLAAAGGPIRLAQRIALATALEMVMTGDQIPAARAYELGLVNRVVRADKVVDEAVALAERINENSPTAVRMGRRLVKGTVVRTDAEAWELNTEITTELFRSSDPIEGATAFAEKRAPQWEPPPA